jgi:STIP1 family protein 1
LSETDLVFAFGSIIADDSNPTLYTNRAMARIKLKQYDSAISDCHASIKLSSANMKAYFILSQCLLALRDFDGALASGLQAHRLGSETNDKSLAQLTTQVLACKKARWDNWEKKRSREGQELECDVISLMQRERGSLMTSCAHEYEQTQIMDEWNQKINLLRATFEKARAESEKKRTVPDWAIDDIGFGIMLDPVIVCTFTISMAD